MLKDKKILITAGPTREAIDPVRYISNRSSGKMGYALAHAASIAGAEVTLISGPTDLTCPEHIQQFNVVSAEEMHDRVMERVEDCDIFIACAAVADYRPEKISDQKIKKTEDEMTIKLVRTKDILAEVSNLPNPPFLVGFAAETENVINNAFEKIKSKKADIIVANEVGEDIAFASDENEVTLCYKDGETEELPLTSKNIVAEHIIAAIAERMEI